MPTKLADGLGLRVPFLDLLLRFAPNFGSSAPATCYTHIRFVILSGWIRLTDSE